MNKSAQKISSILYRAHENNRLPHALLLFGTSINQIEIVAKNLAQKILSCDDVTKHPDFLTLRPEGKARFIKIGSNSDKSGGDWPINTMRWLVTVLKKSSSLGANKVAIVYEADRMNRESANAFLKTLEEPPSGTFIILLTERPYDLLDTIRSRCVNVRIDCDAESLNDEEWIAWQKDFENWIARLSKGVGREISIGDAVIYCYALLNRFNTILSRLSELEEDFEETDAEVLEALEASSRRALRKRLLSDVENRILSAGSVGLPISKIALCIQTLEKCSGFLDLNMADNYAFEFFMLSTMRILASK